MNIFHLGIRNMFPIRCLPACQFQLYFHLFFPPAFSRLPPRAIKNLICARKMFFRQEFPLFPSAEC